MGKSVNINVCNNRKERYGMKLVLFGAKCNVLSRSRRLKAMRVTGLTAEAINEGWLILVQSGKIDCVLNTLCLALLSGNACGHFTYSILRS